MAPNKQAVSQKGQWILSNALSLLNENPPIVEPPVKYGQYDVAIYNKTVNDIVTKKMLEAGYKIDAIFKWDEEYEGFIGSIERLPWENLSQAAFEESLRRACQAAEDLKRSVDAADSSSEDEHWEDVDTSVSSLGSVSIVSVSSKASERSTRLTNAKRSMLVQMKESAKKRQLRTSRLGSTIASAREGQGTTPLKKPPSSSVDTSISSNISSITSNGGSERQGRALKRQASVVAHPEGKAKKTRAPSIDKAGFARSQNHRVQLVKERKEMQDKERIEMIEAKIQQKVQQSKEKKISNDKKASTTAGKKVSTTSNRSTKTATEKNNITKSASTSTKKTSPANKPMMAPPSQTKLTKATLVQEANTATKKNSLFAKPAVPVVAVKSAGARAAKNGSPLRLKNAQVASVPGAGGDRKASPAMTMQDKAKDGLRHGDLAKQAMFQSMLVAGDPDIHCANSTFLPGVDTMPNFDASLALTASPIGETFVVGAKGATPVPNSNATYVSKPGLISSPALDRPNPVNLDASSFIDSFNESYRDYGLDDLNSDSDNTDDENQPSKRVPSWADIRSKRFKSRIARQKVLGDSIEKYGVNTIYMASVVDLEKIFQTTSSRFHRLNTSSGLWNETCDFIKD